LSNRSSQTIIFMPVFNRQATAVESIHNMRMAKGQAHLKIIDDASTAFDGRELAALGDSGEVNAVNLGIDQNRINNLLEFLGSSFEYCYFTDSDTLHDPMFLDRAFQMFDKTASVCSLFNSSTASHLDGFNIDIGEAITIRRSAPGVSQFFDKKIAFRMIQYYLDAIRYRPNVLREARGWDWFFCGALPHMAVSQVSYLEHMYADGLHVARGRDVAMNPTPFVAMEGRRVFAALGIPA